MTTESSTALERLIERNRAETAADIARLETQQANHHADIIAQLDRYLLRQVYEADERARKIESQARDAWIQRIEKAVEDEKKAREKAAEEDQKRRDDEVTANRRMLRSAIVVAVFGVISTVISAALVAAWVKGGGH